MSVVFGLFLKNAVPRGVEKGSAVILGKAIRLEAGVHMNRSEI